ncbi:MAG: DNA-3-methyladenine glycosylase 2 family protein [Lachnospiraceae bacterium]|nr:DNA-3-methyladenine glycosylase 2 family protein [Lachnospiraceae bacterium]
MVIEIKDDFNPEKIYLSGQCFRVRKYDDGGYRFLNGERAVYLRKAGKDTFALSCGEKEWQEIWLPYFDLKRDYRSIRQTERGKDDFADRAMEFGRGIRILRQDPWEMLITFLISQRKNIPAIARSIEQLAAAFGHPITTEYESIQSFPAPKELARACEEELRQCGLGYRTPYILDATKRVLGGELDLSKLSSCSDEELLEQLKTVHGVGVKVADCIALFAYGRLSCAPVDVWIERAIEEEWHGQSLFDIYGDDAGIIQQYIYYYERNGK